MSMNRHPIPLVLDPSWSDSWGQWSGRAAAGLAWLEQESCLYGRFALAPEFAKQVIGDDGYLAFNLRLVPGSVIYGFYSSGQTDVQVMVRDLALGHNFFQEPIPLSSLHSDWTTGRFPSCFLLSTPHPVVGDAMFRCEFYGTPGQRVYLIFGVGEVQACPKQY